MGRTILLGQWMDKFKCETSIRRDLRKVFMCLLVILLLSLSGCGGNTEYDIVTVRGIQQGWKIVLPSNISKSDKVISASVEYSATQSGDKYTVPVKLFVDPQTADLNANFTRELPVNGSKGNSGTASFSLRTRGRLDGSMSRRHPVWDEMKKRGLKQEDILELRLITLDIRADNKGYSFADDGGKSWSDRPYLVPQK